MFKDKMKSIILTLCIMLLSYGCSTGNASRMPEDKLTKVAVANYKIKGGQNLEHLFVRLNDLAAQAHKQNANYLLLPELIVFDLLPVNPADDKLKNELLILAGKFSEFEKGLKKIAKGHKLTVLGASAVYKDKEKFLNRAFFINPKGETKYQDKIFPTPWERVHGFVGGKKIQLFQNEEFSFNILICHDAEFPAITNSLVPMKPELIFVPSQTDDLSGLERVRITSAARAVEHFSFVIMTGASGDKDAPWHSYVGQNFLFTPKNKYFPGPDLKSDDPLEEKLSFFEMNLSLLRKGRQDQKQVYPSRDQLEVAP